MKKCITIILAICILLSSIAGFAETGYTYGVSFCYDGDAYSADYVFIVPEGVDILSVSVTDTSYMYAWNFVESEARLYISIASANVIANAKTIATIVTDKETSLPLASLKINGKDTTYTYGDISFCYDGDAYSVDYVFTVPEGADILSVFVTDTNCMYDWNFVESEARLYISIASANAIAKTKTIGTIVTDKEAALLLASLKINGKTQENAFAEHTATDMDYVAPGFDTPGHIGGERCSNCGVVLTEPESIPPTGLEVNAVLDKNGTLTVSGRLSDPPTAERVTYLSVYDEDNIMLDFKNITELDQSNFSIPIENMKDAHTVKILRWAMPKIIPLHDAVEVIVKGN